MAEPLLEDESLESRCNGLANKDSNPFDPLGSSTSFPEDCTLPDIHKKDVVELKRRIFSLGTCDNMSELISALEQTSLSAHAFQPVYQHKGKANRSTLQIQIDQHSDVYINMDVVVWDQVRKKWGRPICNRYCR